MGKKTEGRGRTNDLFMRALRGLVWSLAIYFIASAVLAILVLSCKVSEKSMPQIAMMFTFFSVFFGALVAIGRKKGKRPVLGLATAAGVILVKLVVSAFSSEGDLFGEAGLTAIGCVILAGILASVIGAGKKNRT